ncbi:Gldg family protein [Teredinibacter franksiae]|uniref:Gldg family protein n=1 Tax=Teredinibacter franksiae TaxID=2761453 RepID=UPI001628CE95|nr:Gldg family protein [Teredinibacter franksiae]
MLPDNKIFSTAAMHVAAKELKLFFSSPIAYLFLGVFVAFTLFIVFWGKAFFARNIADVRPMFESMPVLLIFLSAALTMRMWSEERRSGTLEHVLTLPVSSWQFVQGKFAACKILLVIALILTLPLPITVSLIADLDWGPVISGYLAAALLGSAYLAIGLYISSRSDNQIVSLILTTVVCGMFYLLGTGVFIKLVSNETAEVLRSLGSGSRFESITRGVLDVRDFYYYISIAAVFLVLNRYGLEKDRWATDGDKAHHNRWRLSSALVLANVIAFNFVLAPFSALRIDTTEGKIYSIGKASQGYLKQLQEPLLIRGYFSAKTHPYLAPLVPEIQDLLKEYAEEGAGNIRVEIVDPATDSDAEAEAGSKYGIKPVPFRVDDRYQSAVVNSYFNILIQYGDEYKVMGFENLIEVNARGENDLDVKLRNPEYDITNTIKQVLYAYQSGGNLFDSISGNVSLTAYISTEDRLPETLREFNGALKNVLTKATEDSRGKFSFAFVDPDANGGAVAEEIADTYGFQPMASSIFDITTFYYYLVLSNDEIAVQIALPEDWTEDALNRALDTGLKRFATGFTKTIGIVAPESNPYAAQMGQPVPASFEALQQLLNENMTSKPAKINAGKVAEDLDLLMVLAPENLDEKAVFAIDQFLMRGGTVVMATSPYKAQIQQQGLVANAHTSNLEGWLEHHGVTIQDSLVMDTQNSAFPIPVARQVGAFSVQEISMLDYPYFLEIREQGLNADNPITSTLQQLTIPWASPITVNDEKNTSRTVVKLAESSPSSWLSKALDINPQMTESGEPSFTVGEFVGAQPLAIAISGRFNSYYTGKDSPQLQNKTDTPENKQDDANTDVATEESPEVISGIIEHSPESARLIVVSSNSFAEDSVLRIQSSMAGNNYVNPQQFVINAAEWSLEDEGLLSIRSRSHFNRTLPPLTDKERQFWEAVNYSLAVAGLLLIYLYVHWRRRANESRYRQMLTNLVTKTHREEEGAAA